MSQKIQEFFADVALALCRDLKARRKMRHWIVRIVRHRIFP
jgi:hypothetical protein